MSIEKFLALLAHIKEHHSSPVNRKERSIKYVYPFIDVKYQIVFHVRLREWFKEDITAFYQYSIPEYEPGTLYERIMQWLDEEATP